MAGTKETAKTASIVKPINELRAELAAASKSLTSIQRSARKS